MHELPRSSQDLGGAQRVVGQGEARRGRLAASALEESAREARASQSSDGGESLRALLARRGASGEELLRHLLGAMRGASALHKRGVIHGDVRPENIVVAPGARRLSVIAKLLEPAALTRGGSARFDASGVARVRGDGVYRAPEQRAGWQLDARTDVYAFGMVLHEVLTGRLPASLHALPRTGTGWCPLSLGPDADHVPAGLARLVRAALQPDPALRPNSMEALMAAIEPYTRASALRFALPLPARQRPLRASAARHASRGRVAVAALALLGALGTAVVARPELAARLSEALATGLQTQEPPAVRSR